MKVAIVEFCSPNHSSLLNSWYKYFINREVESIAVLCETDVAERLNLKSIKKINFSGFNKLKSFFKSYQYLNNVDEIVLNSIQTKFIFFSFLLFLLRSKKITLVIHNLNAWRGSNSGPFLKRCIKKACRYIIMMQVDRLCFCSQALKNEYVRVAKGNKKSLLVMPFQTIEELTYPIKSPNKRITVVYPGIVSNKRKEYLAILDAFSELDDNFRLIMLGKLSKLEGGEDIYDEYSNNSNITFFKEFIPEEIFNIHMNEADLLISDLRDGKFVRYDYKETYGLTKDTGVVHLSLKYGIPLLINSEFHKNIENSLPCLSFTGKDDIKNTLNAIMADRTQLDHIQELLTPHRKKILLENVYEEIDKYFKQA